MQYHMNKSTLFGALLPILLLFPSGILHAESLDEEQARYAAAAFFSPSSQSSRLHAKGRQLVLRSEGHPHGCYIFDRPEGGVVFVADDDAVGRTVLGYTDSGSFDSENLPLGLKDWLEQVGVLMDAVHEGKIQRADVRRKVGSVVVPPLIKTVWNQWRPYNNMCPKIGDERCMTGCVATAMAQVMKYWEWPLRGNGFVSYDDPSCGQTLSTNLSAHDYDWENMLDNYSGSYTEAEANAVATLMRDCGYAVHMNYSTKESGASISARTMQSYFLYHEAAIDRERIAYPEEMWHEFIRQDLLAGRPVLYSGQSTQNGHEFILDGFDTEGYYHVNWGWGGVLDGSFMLTDLNNYNSNQWMISCLMPKYGSSGSFSYTLEDGVLTIQGNGAMPQEYQMQDAPWKEECGQVRKIVIGEGITSIVEAFGYAYNDGKQYKFNNLEELVLPEGLLSIGQDAFLSAEKLASVELPSTLIRMNYAFFYCRNLRSLHLPKSLEEFEDELPNLAELTVDEENPFMSAKDNVLYDKSGKHLLLAPPALKTIFISETTEEILDASIMSTNGISILSKCMTAPLLPPRILNQPSSAISPRGCLFIPYGSAGYESLTDILPSGWRVIYFNIDRIPEMKITWTLDGGTLTLSGWGEQDGEQYGADRAPYYQDRSQVQRLVVEEGITGLCQEAFKGYGSLTDAELPSTFAFIGNNCFEGTGVTTITCYAKQAPVLGTSAFKGLPKDGTLRVPEGTDYSSWLNALPDGWKIEVFADHFITCFLYTGATSTVKNLQEWDALLITSPNTVGIINPRYEEWAYMTHNVLIEDVAAEGGYRCPDFRLTDLTYGYSTAMRAPRTGFSTPVSFTVTKGEYKRKLIEGYNTVCLPFAVKEEGLPKSCRMYAFSHYDTEEGRSIFSPQAMTETGHACILTCNKAEVEWLTDLSGMTFTTQQASTEDSNMRGTFVTTEDYQGIGYSPRAKDNVFAPLAQYLHPFRACFIIDTPSAPAEVRICLSDDATGLSYMSDKPGTSGLIFNLSGQRLSKAKKGINIIDGKMIVR